MTSSRGKRRKERARPRVAGTGQPQPSTRVRRARPQPPRGRSGPPMLALAVGAVVVVGALLALAYLGGFLPGADPGATASRAPIVVSPPDATPLVSPPAEPAGDGTRATIETAEGNIVIELFNQSSPVAAQNFANLARAGYYDGVVFHRIVPGFMVQGGDPEGTGRGGPGYGIPDEPVVGQYVRGTVAMARTALPNSQGSQFFIVVADSPHLAQTSPGYAIFGRVVSGMEVADRIVAGPRTGPQNDLAVEPVVMNRVTIEAP